MAIRESTDIPYGNATAVSISETPEGTDIEFAPDSHGGPECLWFCFRLEEDGEVGRTSDTIRLILNNPGNMLGGGAPHNFRPVVRRSGDEWRRIGPPVVEELPDGRLRAVWSLDAPKSVIDVAFCFPYGIDEVHALVDDSHGVLKRDIIGCSQGGRSMIRLSNDCGEPGNDRPGLYLLARQHSGETPGSWVMDGFVRQMVAHGEKAPLLWAVPLANIDGVELGDYGKDNFPYDLNRAWGVPPMRHETMVIRNDIERWAARCRPVLAIDFHAPGASEGGGAYFFVPDPQKHPEEARAVSEWTEGIGRALLPAFAADDFSRVARYPSRWDTMRFTQYCWTHKLCALTIETPYAMSKEAVLGTGEYRRIGELAADAVVAKLSS